MNILLLKQLSILSVFAGLMLGLLGSVSYFTFILSIILTMFFVSVFVLVYFKRNDLIGIINVREGCILGSVIGFVSFIGFSVVFAPVSMIIGWIFPSYTLGFLRYFMGGIGTFIVMLFLILFMAGIAALFNGFSGLVTAYVYELITGIKKENNQNETIDFEIK